MNPRQTIRRKAVERAARSVLIPRGFQKSKGGVYPCMHGEMVHAVYFQADRYGNGVFLRSLVHFTFLPSRFNNLISPMTEWNSHDYFMLNTMRSLLADTRLEDPLRLRETMEETEAAIAPALQKVVEAMEGFRQRFPDDRAFLTHLPPEIISVANELRSKIILGPHAELPADLPLEGKPGAQEILFRGWSFGEFQMCYFLAIAALRHGDIALAARYAEVARGITWVSNIERKQLADLQLKIAAVRGGGAG